MTPEPLQPPTAAAAPDVGVVVIGRNEGDRLVRCIQSVQRQGAGAVVYVDSGSTDGSAERARGMGCTAIALEMTRPFTAARARNAGWRALPPEVAFVQFIDGDCELADGWLLAARTKLVGEETLAGVAGRLRERFPDATPYNKLCDMEWAAPPGDTIAVGGVSMMRRSALEQVGGFSDDLIAGEEPELCLRLREQGWRLWRLADDMGWHDADMHRFGQWWTRAVRCGHSQLEVSLLHRQSAKRIWARESRSTFAWAVIPTISAFVATLVLALAIGWPWALLGLLPLGLYVLLFLKVAVGRARKGHDARSAILYAANVTVAKFPQFQGQVRYWRNRLLGRRSSLIEYRRGQLPATEGA